MRIKQSLFKIKLLLVGMSVSYQSTRPYNAQFTLHDFIKNMIGGGIDFFTCKCSDKWISCVAQLANRHVLHSSNCKVAVWLDNVNEKLRA
ncbi:hypothetical protein NPIL_6681 [Nephila pilipes]|uniref:Uncharacterized protein n=1 Tax=Nephila pilipes TaxID=299642 RepID=A0A8X6UE75_NEPPI|nr:hypothetical protein NPIL_6681 [Nephila pilipes]